MTSMKPYRTYSEQLNLLIKRGMSIEDGDYAEEQIRIMNYYRLSGYWYPFRRLENDERSDYFIEGTTFSQVMDLYKFDERIRSSIFTTLAPVELAMRAFIGHELGYIDACAYLKPEMLSAVAWDAKRNKPTGEYKEWLEKYQKGLMKSREDFVEHHRTKYEGILPIWAAVETMDWGELTHLYRMCPKTVREKVAMRLDITPLTAYFMVKMLEYTP